MGIIKKFRANLFGDALKKCSNYIVKCQTDENGMGSCLRRLKKIGYYPQNAVDIGAFDGQWTLMFKSFFPDANVFMIEAQESKRDNLEKIRQRYIKTVQYKIALLGKDESNANFYISSIDDTSGSTLYPECSNIPQDPINLKIEPLDNVIPRNFSIDFMKIDVQGAELDVLQGAKRTLIDVQVIIMEVALLQYNLNAPLISDVLHFMKKLSFVCLDIAGIHRHKVSNKFPIQIDILFAKNDSHLIPSKFHYGI